MKKVKLSQKKAEAAESGIENSYSQKTIEPSFSISGSKGVRARSAKGSTNELRGANGLTMDQESQPRIMKEQLFNQNKSIQSLKRDIEDIRTTA